MTINRRFTRAAAGARAENCNQTKDDLMNKLMTALALCATATGSQAIAQKRAAARGGAERTQMTRDEAKQTAGMIFKRFDTNGDGTITRPEAQAVASQFGNGATQYVDRMFGATQSITLQQAEAKALARFDA